MAATGTVKFFNTAKGFGFIVPEGGGSDVFVHARDLRSSGVSTVTEGQSVAFDIEPGREGKPKASNIRVLTPGTPG